jgi:hypothetical protein
MVTSAVTSPSGQAATERPTQSDVVVAAVAKIMRHRKQEGEALVRLVEQSTASGDKGQHVNYYG